MKKAACLGLVLFALMCLHIPTAALNIDLDGKVVEPDWDRAEYIQFNEQVAEYIVFAAAYYAVEPDGRTLNIAVQVCTNQPGTAPGKSAVAVKLATGETIVMPTDLSSQGDYRYPLQYAAHWDMDTDVCLEAKITLPVGGVSALKQLQISYLDKKGLPAAVQHVSPALPAESTGKPQQNNGVSGSSAQTGAPAKEPIEKSTKFSFTGDIPSTRANQSGQKEQIPPSFSEEERNQASEGESGLRQNGMTGQDGQPTRNRVKTVVFAAAACVAVIAGGLILLPVFHKKPMDSKENRNGPPPPETKQDSLDQESGEETDIPDDKPDAF